MIAHRARVGVITDIRIVGIDAPFEVVELIVRAWISVIAHNGLGHCACPILARLDGAKASVITGPVDRRIRASCVSPTCVFGTWITIVTIEGHLACADAVFAHISDGAGVSVVA